MSELIQREVPDDAPLRSQSGDAIYVLRKRGFFYRLKNLGYTSEIQDAQRYTEAEAINQIAGRKEVTMHLASEFERPTPAGRAAIVEAYEKCAKLADWMAECEQGKIDKAEADPALSDGGLRAIRDHASGSRSTAKAIALGIRALSGEG